MSRILVVGSSGQVAQALAETGQDRVVCLGRPAIDLTDAGSIERALDTHQPIAVINAGAYTSVDGAESEQQSAYALNVEGPRSLARACAERSLPLIHLSTDCVFDGTKPTPYTPADRTSPLGVYGYSKLEGEVAVRAAAPESLIVRVSWIFSRYGRSFVRSMLDLARRHGSIKVVQDQQGCPTYAPALAAGLISMAEQAAAREFHAWGTYHLAGEGETNRADMARMIFAESARLGGPVATVVPIDTADFPTPAKRPLNARLDSKDARLVFGVELPDWKLGLSETVRALIEETA